MASLLAAAPFLAAAPAEVPIVAVAPFVLLLLAIAVLPIVAHHWWESNRNRGIVSAVLAGPVALWLLFGPDHGGHWLAHAGLEYAAFLALLGSLFVITGGIHIGGSLAGTPAVNAALLGVGAAIASVVGTTGASMLLIRPLLRANAGRARKAHLVVFFIFLVSNAGGLLTPLGDPPLFLGFLRGVPFDWTLRLWGPWLFVNGALLAIFYGFDRAMVRREPPVTVAATGPRERLRIDGKLNFLWLLGVVMTSLVVGSVSRQQGWSQEARDGALVLGMVTMAALSLLTTPGGVRPANKFSWAPIVEVAVIFAGIFVTMVPAMKLLDTMGAEGKIALTEPWQYFWVTGALSAFLDNAPTYVTFATIACGVVGRATGVPIAPTSLDRLAADPEGAAYLEAISCGAVFLGAGTYIGNGPNFMVKAIAEENGVRMPSFFGYVVWSAAILVPVLVALTFVSFR
ncbi:MAG: sodium:proton antiporter [Myxococcales bacterium]|nr:sodium:proton antiporter [Myxococcales bacterium]